MKIKYLIIIVLACIVGFGLYYVMQQRQSVIAPTTTPAVISPDQASQASPTIPLDLKRGGNSYSDPKGVFTLLYPNDWKMDIQGDNEFIRFYKTGATQRGQTEMYDGVIMVFEVVDLQGTGLETWVDTKIQSTTADGTLRITKPKQSITMNGYKGFTYSAAGLGEGTYTVLQKDSSSQTILNITTLVQDPQNIGYQQEVDVIMASLQIRK